MNKHTILQAEKLFFAKLYSKTRYALQISESKQHVLRVPSSYNSIPSAQSTLIFPIISVISILKSVINRCLFPSFIFHHKSKFPSKKKITILTTFIYDTSSFLSLKCIVLTGNNYETYFS